MTKLEEKIAAVEELIKQEEGKIRISYDWYCKMLGFKTTMDYVCAEGNEELRENIDFFLDGEIPKYIYLFQTDWKYYYQFNLD